jgi:hypothetical protein
MLLSLEKIKKLGNLNNYSFDFLDKTINIKPLFLISTFILLIVSLYKIFIGVDFNDEAQYAAELYVLQNEGKPYLTDFFLQQSAGLIFWPFFKLYFSIFGSEAVIIVLRILYFALSTALSLATYFYFKKYYDRFFLFLIYIIMIGFVPYSIPSISYNTITFLLFSPLCLLAFKKIENFFEAIIAGIIFSIICISYQSFAAAGLALFSLHLVLYKNAYNRKDRAKLFLFISSFSLSSLLFFFAFIFPNLENFLSASQFMFKFSDGIKTKVHFVAQFILAFCIVCYLLYIIFYKFIISMLPSLDKRNLIFPFFLLSCLAPISVGESHSLHSLFLFISILAFIFNFFELRTLKPIEYSDLMSHKNTKNSFALSKDEKYGYVVFWGFLFFTAILFSLSSSNTILATVTPGIVLACLSLTKVFKSFNSNENHITIRQLSVALSILYLVANYRFFTTYNTAMTFETKHTVHKADSKNKSNDLYQIENGPYKYLFTDKDKLDLLNEFKLLVNDLHISRGDSILSQYFTPAYLMTEAKPITRMLNIYDNFDREKAHFILEQSLKDNIWPKFYIYKKNSNDKNDNLKNIFLDNKYSLKFSTKHFEVYTK